MGRGYGDKNFLPHINKDATFTKSQLLARFTTINNTRTFPSVISYNPNLKQTPHILKQHSQYIESDPVLSQIWQNQPVMAYLRHKRPLCMHQIYLATQLHNDYPSDTTLTTPVTIKLLTHHILP